jgi:peroxiredoxin
MFQTTDGTVRMNGTPRTLWLAALSSAALSIGVLSVPARADLAGSEAPDFVLRSASGQNHRLSEYRGRVVLLSFWASWCGECRSQLESLTALHDRYQGWGLEFLTVSLDRDLKQVGDAATSLGVRFPALHDAAGAVGERYAVDRMPYLLLIDQNGIVREEFTGYRKGEEASYVERARALLGE